MPLTSGIHSKKRQVYMRKHIHLFIAAFPPAGCAVNEKGASEMIKETYSSGELMYIPESWRKESEYPGTLEKLIYETWESFTYEEHKQKLEKTAYVYLPYGYTEEKKYDIFYISHGGWSNETTTMGTDTEPASFKNVIDHAIRDKLMKEMIIVLPTYNNTSASDSGDYSLALRLTDRFHNELVNDLMPAVERKYSTYAEDTTDEGLKASRDHRGFGGFSMGSVNTWCTFRYCLDYFRYFMPMSGNYATDGQYMASLVKDQGYSWKDFFIWSASGTDDFAYSAFKAQIMNMSKVKDGTFRFGANEKEGNLAFFEREGYSHDREACEEYTFNGLCFFFKEDEMESYTYETNIQDVIDDPVFEGCGRLIFPVSSGYYSGTTLADLELTWYSGIDPAKTVEICNDLRTRATKGGTCLHRYLYGRGKKKGSR